MTSSRLLDLLLILQTRHRVTTAQLARQLGVSRRTVLRDVGVLSTGGVPVYAERGRHGGIVLLPGARLNVSHLDPPEREALSVTGLDDAQLHGLGLSAAHERALRKMAARQEAPGDRGRLADLVVVDNTAWLADPPGGADVAALALDLRAGRRLSVRYRRSAETRSASTVVDPYGLAGKAGRWYLVADEDGVARLFALERLETHELLPEPAVLRPGCSLAAVWAELRARTETPGRVTVTTRLRASRLDLARRILGSRIHEVGDPVAGWCRVTLRYPDVESVRQLLQFADHIQVLDPPEARERVARLAREMAERHALPTTLAE
ncbi:WYL domain-containing protein [Nakamurella flavida]|uniref:WYL domain-containing protein n=1 Tax=Nakamurella flavida TaxID=363630 RepID=A0A938YPU4_9ACTN|nr:WYL domain-containing protein [Nakamurella flavida]MBM9478496.1 WYL domain-containing protein [Nakamurella flavida]MDP9777678.1 putative DNA-binding transcriptional regulator YafY [Nakamurella flavida]